MKVCHGVEEIAGQGYYSVYGLNLIGINSKELLWYNNKFTYDIRPPAVYRPKPPEYH